MAFLLACIRSKVDRNLLRAGTVHSVQSSKFLGRQLPLGLLVNFTECFLCARGPTMQWL